MIAKQKKFKSVIKMVWNGNAFRVSELNLFINCDVYVVENIYVGMWFLEYPINNLAVRKWGEDCQRWLISFSINENEHQKKIDNK